MIFQFCGYSASFFTGYVNPAAMDSIGWRYYVVACAMLGFECAFAWWYLPETRGKGLEEVGEIFNGEELPDRVRMEQHAGNALRERKPYTSHAEDVGEAYTRSLRRV
ncbi:hypothetical protein BJX65DRAFT_291451 [Aspergillus insuetus]